LLDRSRTTLLGLAGVCFALFALLAVAFKQEWALIVDVDDASREWRDWAVDTAWLHDPLRWVEVVFGTVGMTILTTVLAVAMFAKGYRRAAAFAVGVMIATALTNTVLKVALDRARPVWQSVEHLLETNAFPSGHASSVAAFGGIVMVLVAMLVRRANLRRLAYAATVVVVLLVCADRVLLGRHYITDVSAGVLLGAGFVLLGLAIYSPLPRSHAEKIEPLPEAVPSERRLAVILNPAKVEDVGQFQAIVSAMAVEAGWSTPVWHLTTVEDSGTGQAHQAAVGGADLVIVCGGDGTVREVCAELAGTGVPVGIVPAGTGNLLARNLDIPLYVRAAIDVALTGQDRAIDMVSVNGDNLEDTHFMVMAGMGLDAAIMEGVNEDIKKKVGWIAYVISGAKALMFPPVRLEISVDGKPPTKHRARTVIVGNVGTLTAGMPLLPDARIDDGLLDVVLLHPQRFLSWLPLAWRILSKRPHTDELVNRMRGRSVVIRADRDTPRELDGDTVGAGRELRMTCLHARLLVRVPR
jgi:YegS/Rv2252/BmrU family lipid kinase